MSRSVADATRFTATSPHAYSKPASILRSAAKTYSPSSFTASGSALPSRKQPPASSSNPYPPQQSGRPPPNETPQQKVARLRALRAAEKLKPLGLWDRTVVRGRRWADIAHRTTVYGLMGASGTSQPFPSSPVFLPLSILHHIPPPANPPTLSIPGPTPIHQKAKIPCGKKN